MKISSNAAALATAALGKHEPKADKPLNPAQQARAADPSAKGAAFGALVSQFARAKHAPPPPVVTEPPTTETTTEGPTEPLVDVVV